MIEDEEKQTDSAPEEQASDQEHQSDKGQENIEANRIAEEPTGPAKYQAVEQPAPKKAPKPRNTGYLLQQIGLNMLMVGLLALLGFLVWQRFFRNDQDLALASEAEIPVQEGSGGPIPGRRSEPLAIVL